MTWPQVQPNLDIYAQLSKICAKWNARCIIRYIKIVPKWKYPSIMSTLKRMTGKYLLNAFSDWYHVQHVGTITSIYVWYEASAESYLNKNWSFYTILFHINFIYINKSMQVNNTLGRSTRHAHTTHHHDCGSGTVRSPCRFLLQDHTGRSRATPRIFHPRWHARERPRRDTVDCSHAQAREPRQGQGLHHLGDGASQWHSQHKLGLRIFKWARGWDGSRQLHGAVHVFASSRSSMCSENGKAVNGRDETSVDRPITSSGQNKGQGARPENPTLDPLCFSNKF